MNGKKRKQRLLALGVTVAAIVFIGLSSYDNAVGTHVAYSFQSYWAQPALYTPGTFLPTAYLQINYTGGGMGQYYYVISYNSTSGYIVAGHGTASVSDLAVFRAYVNIPAPSNGVTVATAQVYNGSDQNGTLVYTASIVV
ncbi:MAG: hypothetical protein JRN13_06830 [Nitrososphaerota archaeon]|nr:hypothetical protein [Nitrososphaerota archaeon]MDG6960222.1 hypothetical protein [Nitrososphaerota archaeon]MDG6973032.1 hypothetical protein [Nitrososphaerota archaeon]MDG7014867.1 hypothetical protein [Nitrososphaerota archaeon]